MNPSTSDPQPIDNGGNSAHAEPLNRLTPAEQATEYLHSEMPLTRAMMLAVNTWDGMTVALSAPLEPNQNHADTAFGGSISTLGIIAGYCLLWLACKDRGISTRILIQHSSTEDLRPIDHDFAATATFTGTGITDFLKAIQRKRRGRATVESLITCQSLVAAKHTGIYVALLY
ncbi:MAG TPA: YiiD C-terminal domain-containing protein [Phycisphaerae bacterium]|jgi:thioesterase domain-containing protein